MYIYRDDCMMYMSLYIYIYVPVADVSLNTFVTLNFRREYICFFQERLLSAKLHECLLKSILHFHTFFLGGNSESHFDDPFFQKPCKNQRMLTESPTNKN